MSESEQHTDARLRAVETQVTRLVTYMESQFGATGRKGHLVQQLDEIREDLDKITNQLIGRGDLPGLVTRVDRLERSEERRSRYERAGALALVGLLAKAVWDLMFGGG